MKSIKEKLAKVSAIIEKEYPHHDDIFLQLRLIDMNDYDPTLFDKSGYQYLNINIPDFKDTYKDFDIEKYNQCWINAASEVFKQPFSIDDFDCRLSKYLNKEMIHQISVEKLYQLNIASSKYQIPKLSDSLKELLSGTGEHIGVYRKSRDTITVGYIDNHTGDVKTDTRKYVFHIDETGVACFNLGIKVPGFKNITVWLTSEELEFIQSYKKYLTTQILSHKLKF